LRPLSRRGDVGRVAMLGQFSELLVECRAPQRRLRAGRISESTMGVIHRLRHKSCNLEKSKPSLCSAKMRFEASPWFRSRSNSTGLIAARWLRSEDEGALEQSNTRRQRLTVASRCQV